MIHDRYNCQYDNKKPSSLPMNHYSSQDNFHIAVDCIIYGFSKRRLQLLLIKRDFAPRRGEWSLMGGFVRKGESLDGAASRVLTDLTGLQDVYLEQFRAFGEIDRDPVARTISVGYFALVNQEALSGQLSTDYVAHWVALADEPPLIFDHDEVLRLALQRLRYRAKHEPIGFELLPERFTLSALQVLYEAIFGQPIDAGNFRRRLKKMDFVERLDEKDFSESRKATWWSGSAPFPTSASTICSKNTRPRIFWTRTFAPKVIAALTLLLAPVTNSVSAIFSGKEITPPLPTPSKIYTGWPNYRVLPFSD